MKTLLRGILAIFLYLLIPGVFGGIGAGVFFWVIKPSFDAEKINKNGIETKAIVTGLNSNVTSSSSSGSTTTTKRYFYLTLSFNNSNEYTIECKTSSIYPEEFIRKQGIKQGETVLIKYIGSKAVVKGFTPKYETWLWAFPIVFGAIAVGFLCILIFSYILTVSNYIIEKFGTPVTGTFLESRKLFKNSDLDFCSIICTYKNSKNDIVEIKTNYSYSNSVVEDLAQVKSFPIIYLGKKAFIKVENKNINKDKVRHKST